MALPTTYKYPTLDYETARELYNSGRKYKYVGVKLPPSMWLTYDQFLDRYVLAYTKSKYYSVIAPSGLHEMKKAGAGQRDKYTQEVVGFIYPTHVHLLPATRSGNRTHSFFADNFSCMHRKSQSITFKGFEWAFFDADVPSRKRYYGNVDAEIIQSGAGVYIYPDRVEADNPILVRVHKKAEQKAMNDHIKIVRRMLTLRAKMGLFSSMDWVAINRELVEKYEMGPHGVMDDPKKLDAIFAAIDDEDYNTMLPILWMAIANGNSSYYLNPFGSIDSSYDWKAAFEKLIGTVRERLRTHKGAVEYVFEKPQTENSQGA